MNTRICAVSFYTLKHLKLQSWNCKIPTTHNHFRHCRVSFSSFCKTTFLETADFRFIYLYLGKHNVYFHCLLTGSLTYMCHCTEICILWGNKGLETFFSLILSAKFLFSKQTIHQLFIRGFSLVKMLLLTGEIGRAYKPEEQPKIAHAHCVHSL